ncbi:larval cuticle protein 65Ag1-like isoform X2 [Danaus plexippus]|uniref:larval cuticle protein 65Ag1-like isoform X2 n=1 Tax=Danaus plexippus TaxID=13037 RepID=UPI002AB165B4|nr:larval cuticle protein 65Ag1-like isoform X2 [Danaus plexippus]
MSSKMCRKTQDVLCTTFSHANVICLASLVGILGAAPAIESQPKPQVLSYEMNTANMPNSYNYHYNSSDGSSRTEQGEFVDPGTGEASLNVAGAVRWYDDKGHLYEMTYKAGRRGYTTIIKKLS